MVPGSQPAAPGLLGMPGSLTHSTGLWSSVLLSDSLGVCLNKTFALLPHCLCPSILYCSGDKNRGELTQTLPGGGTQNRSVCTARVGAGDTWPALRGSHREPFLTSVPCLAPLRGSEPISGAPAALCPRPQLKATALVTFKTLSDVMRSLSLQFGGR